MKNLVTAPIDVGELRARVADPRAGAVVVFEGTTRSETGGRGVVRLEYEAYEKMATRSLEEIRRRTLERFGAIAVAIQHRIGRLSVGETSVAIVVSSAHRAAAFDACRFAIEEIKHIAPIWKKEVFDDGSESWVHPGAEC